MGHARQDFRGAVIQGHWLERTVNPGHGRNHGGPSLVASVTQSERERSAAGRLDYRA